MRPFAAQPVPDWVPDVAFTIPSGWTPATGRLRSAFATTTAESAVRATAVPLHVHGRIQDIEVHAAVLTAADRRLADHDVDEFADGLERLLPAPRVVARIDLPIGPSLRLRTRIRSSAQGPEQALVQYMTPVVGTCRVVLSLVTGDLAYEQEFVDTLDGIALSMTLS